MSVSTDTKDQKKSKPEIPSLKSLERDFGQKFAYPASTKTYLEGSRPDIKAPFRMIEQLIAAWCCVAAAHCCAASTAL